MAIINKINQEYLMHLQEERELLNSVIYDDLKKGKKRDLQEQDLEFLIPQIKSSVKSIESQCIIEFVHILKEQNIDADKINVIIQSTINKNNQNTALLNYLLGNGFNVIKQLQSRINVAHKFKMHLQGKTDKKPKSEKEFIQTFAAEVWDKDPDITRKEILNRVKEIRRINAADSTILRNWLEEIDPKAKNGERRKRKSKKMTN
ncbi:hypothetical protein [Haemophilus haemolyticus]|uniref:hypothetical protein n=1 Tax=Haemophilus haemolyticus TaxID=726 RepID=UPI0015C626F9|nr:hypothetical protein [Haemophilus haemolyticus]NYA46961.1 hypothetical protein [Haemophilus haemolyticus]